MEIACLDLEGVLVPEVWVGLARQTGIDELSLTTRDVPDYDELMRRRLRVLNQHDLRLPDIERVVATLEPLHGAVEFLDRLRRHFQPLIVSDTFYEFAAPLMEPLGFPTLLCHRLDVGPEGRIRKHLLRQSDPKRQVVRAMQGLRYRVIAAGDSYNDVSMLQSADAGILFRPPQRMSEEYPEFPVADDHRQLAAHFARLSERDLPQ